MQAPQVHLSLVLDGSGSMQHNSGAVRKGLKAVIKELREQLKNTPGEVFVSIWLYGSEAMLMLDNEPINSEKLNPGKLGSYYNARMGGTATDDTLWYAIHHLLDNDGYGLPVEATCAVVVLTDGDCNYMHGCMDFSELTTKMAQLQESGQFSFAFLGEHSRSVTKMQSRYPIPGDNVARFGGDVAGAFNKIATGMCHYLEEAATGGGGGSDHLLK